MRPGHMPWLLLSLVTAVATGAVGSGRSWEAHFLQDYPLAICNDGSPAAYYYRRGDVRSRAWLVFLEGGMWCWDTASCRSGVAGISSSKNFPRTRQAINFWASHQRGIFEDHTSPFAYTHVAYVRTCSNDAFMGDASPEDHAYPMRGQTKLHFRGKRIIEAVFADLRRNFGLGEGLGDRVIYGGCSAGARGALVSLDYVAENLVGRAQVIGLLDSPLWVPIAPLGPSVASFEQQTASVLELHNTTGFISKDCETAYPGAMRWKCLMAAYRLPFVRTPYVLSHSQYDKFAINWNLKRGFWLPKERLNSTVLAFAERYRKTVLDYLPNAAATTGNIVFSSACYYHCTTMFEFIHSIRIQGVTLAELLNWVLMAPLGVPLAQGFRADCQGLGCGQCQEAAAQV